MISPRSGRTKIAQRFIAGSGSVSTSSDRHCGFVPPVSRARPPFLPANPSTKSAGLFSSVRFADSVKKAIHEKCGLRDSIIPSATIPIR